MNKKYFTGILFLIWIPLPGMQDNNQEKDTTLKKNNKHSHIKRTQSESNIISLYNLKSYYQYRNNQMNTTKPRKITQSAPSDSFIEDYFYNNVSNEHTT